jgi:serine/threonine protein kinase
MTPEQREEAVFEAALKLPASERAAFLGKACTGDAELRHRVVGLLSAFERAGSFMNQRATPGRTVGPAEKPGDRIGRYKLLEQIGEGGCGVVYVAEQEEPLRRHVALKIIKLGMDTKQVIARFDAERQALAMMDHPNIARIHDAGATETGRPYFVMELVRGIRITDYCEQHQLAARERLDLFIEVCRAVQHAHQKGIIHRDIKPSNVLVASDDGVPVPKVIDFGIAKATQGRLTDQTVYTAFEQFIGTPAYMSPEQAQLTMQDLDTRTDIYSLGVLLYELLTDTTPFDAKELLSKGLDEMRRTIREVEPVKPSTRLTQGLVAADVRRRSQESERESASLRRRVHEVRGDLDWIVMKCLEKDRTRRYDTASGLATDISRHLSNEPIVARPPGRLYEFQKTFQRHKFGFAATAAVILALAVGLAVSTRMYWQAQTERKKAQAQKERAETEAARSEQVAKIMTEMLEGARPSIALGRDATVLRDILERTATRIQKELTNQPEVQGDLWFTLGKTYSDISDQTNAVVMYAYAVKSYRQCFPEGHTRLALALSYLGAAQSFCQNLREGTNNAALGLSMARQLKDEKTLAMCLTYYGYSLKELGGGVPEAVPYIKEALAISRKFGTNQSYVWMLSRLATSMANDDEEKLPLAREVLAAEVALAGGDSPTVAYRHFGVGQALLDLGRPVEAESELRQALKLWRKYYVSDHPHRDQVFRYLIDALVRQEKWAEAEAEAQYEDQLTSTTNRYVPLHAAIQIAQGNWEQAVKVLAPVVTMLSHGTNNLTATVLALKGNPGQYHEHSRQILEQTPPGPDYIRMEWAARATLLLPPESDALPGAGALADAVSEIPGDLRFSPWASMTRSLAEYRRGNFDAAAEWSTRSISVHDAADPCLASARFIQTMACSRLGDSDQARKAFAAGNQILKKFRTGKRLGDGIVCSYSQLKEFWYLQDWLSVEVLRREAASLLQAGDPGQEIR